MCKVTKDTNKRSNSKHEVVRAAVMITMRSSSRSCMTRIKAWVFLLLFEPNDYSISSITITRVKFRSIVILPFVRFFPYEDLLPGEAEPAIPLQPQVTQLASGAYALRTTR